MQRFFKAPYPGLVMFLGGLAWQAVSNNWTPKAVYIVGSIWAIGSQFVENWRLRQERKPRLKMLFDQDKGAPFVRDKPLYHKNKQPAGTLRIFNVGLSNAGESAPNVAVLLTRIEPSELSAYWTSPLHIANEEDLRIARRDIHLSVEPLVFAEVLSQVFEGDGPATSLRVRFANTGLFEKQLPLRDRYFITLAIDGIGADRPKRFVVQRNAKGRYEMRPAI